MKINCDDCKNQDIERIYCNFSGRVYDTCYMERNFGNCGKIANNFVPNKHDPQVDHWKVICENCTKILMVLTNQIETKEYDDLTTDEFRKQYPCTHKGGQCLGLKKLLGEIE